MSTLIFGKGFVGKATAGIVGDDVIWHDPALGHEVNDLSNIDRVLICVPTPAGTNGLDHTAVYDCLTHLKNCDWAGPVAVRCTCTPAALENMLTLNENLVYWPEFLRERTAMQDALNPVKVVLGGTDTNVRKWELWLRGIGHAKDAIWTITDLKTAALIKVGHNAALAAKVMMFNSLYKACQDIGADWESVRLGVGSDPRIGTGQTVVPGPDGHFGFGGKCLPKDLGALAAMLPDDQFLSGITTQNTAIRFRE
jgi:UDPglucose 6-dehydrogenase